MKFDAWCNKTRYFCNHNLYTKKKVSYRCDQNKGNHRKGVYTVITIIQNKCIKREGYKIH